MSGFIEIIENGSVEEIQEYFQTNVWQGPGKGRFWCLLDRLNKEIEKHQEDYKKRLDNLNYGDYEEFKSFCMKIFNSWKVDPFRHLESISSVIEGLFEQFEKRKNPPPLRTPVMVKSHDKDSTNRYVLRFSTGDLTIQDGEKVLKVFHGGATKGSYEFTSEWRLLTQEEKDLFNA